MNVLSHSAHSFMPGSSEIACPMAISPDMFKNYEERGERFRQAVEAL